MLHDLADRHSDREVWWVHGARGPQEHPLAAEAQALLGSLPHAHEHVFYSATTGRITREALPALALPADATAYLCGPSAFMDEVRDALVALGIAADRVHTEQFAARSAVNPGVVGRPGAEPHPPPGPPGTGPLVTFARSGLAVPFAPERASVLELAEACDVPTRWSCRTGVCHTCVTSLLSGEVSYSPDPLEAPSEGEVLLCCSRPDTDIVVDI